MTGNKKNKMLLLELFLAHTVTLLTIWSKRTLSITILSLLLVHDDTIILGLEPLHGVLLHKSVWEANATRLLFSVPDVQTGTTEDNIKVHTIDTDTGIIFDSQVDVLLDTETEVTILAKILTTQLIFTDLK
jgi:hypothetical protein